MTNAPIVGGYILLARRLFEGELMCKPPLYLKLWLWMLARANWKDRDKLKRGQFVASLPEMQDGMSYYVGYRKAKPTRAEIRGAYEHFAKAGMISHAKSTRGLVITINNFAHYQDPKSYGPHNGNLAELAAPAHDTENKETGNNDYSRTKAGRTKSSARVGSVTLPLDVEFERFWSSYPRKVAKEAAFKVWRQVGPSPALVDRIILAIEGQKKMAQWQDKTFIPYPGTWLRGRRWEDSTEAGEPGDAVDEMAELRAKGVIE